MSDKVSSYNSTPEAVSYTHLDVYKRQLLDDASTLLLFSKGKKRAEEASKIGSKTDTIEHDESHEREKKGAIEMAAAALATASTVSLPLKKATEQSAAEAATSTAAKEETENQPQKQPQWPVPDSYIVDPDAGIITCICDLNDDDGFTIQCDHCNRWQHAICYGIKDIGMAPDDYLCNSCDPREVDILIIELIHCFNELSDLQIIFSFLSLFSRVNNNSFEDILDFFWCVFDFPFLSRTLLASFSIPNSSSPSFISKFGS